MDRPESDEKTTQNQDRIGLIGVGLMGLAIAERLIAGDERVLGWDVDPDRRRALVNARGQIADTVDDVFARCRRVILSLPDSSIVTRTLHTCAELIQPGQIVIDTSTGSPEDAERLAGELAKREAAYLDATISGNSEQLRRAEVLLMAGGDRTAFDSCADLFTHFCEDAVHAGPPGNGARMKLVTNLVLGLNRAALAEGLVFAKSMGLDAAGAFNVLQRSMAYSRVMDAKGAQMLEEDFAPRARLSQHLKDVRLMIDAAGKTGANLPLSETHRKLLVQAESLGLGALDNSAIILAIEQAKKEPGKS